MKRTAVIFILIFSGILFSQKDWVWQNPLPQGNSLTDIKSINSTVGYASGEYGTILKTNSSALNWQLLNFPFNLNISKIDFLDENEGWAIGIKDSLCYLFHTTNGGNSWQEKHKEKASKASLFFLNKSAGWFSSDSTLYFSNDDGASWSAKQFPGTISSIYFFNNNYGWITIGLPIRNIIYKTTDGGTNWIQIEVKEFNYSQLDKIEFVDTITGYISSIVEAPNEYAGKLFKTTDGGYTWALQLSVGGVFVGYRNFSDFHFLNKNLGWAFGGGEIFKTYNGKDWNSISYVHYLKYITVIDSLNLWGAGELGSLFNSTDGGYSWNKSYTGTVTEISDVQLFNSKILFAAGGHSILKTSDGGENWQNINIGDYLNGNYFQIRAVWFLDSSNGWIGVENSGGWGGLYKTTDGGNLWTSQVDSVLRIFDIFFLDDKTGWFFSGGDMYRTNDSGKTWEIKTVTKPDADIESVYFISPDIGFAGGYLGLFKTSNGGQDWTKIDLNMQGPFITSIFFIDSITGWAAGYYDNYGMAVKTTDGGFSWNINSLGLDCWPQSINFTNKNNGWVVGNLGLEGIALHSSDGGESWQSVSLPAKSTFNRIVFSDNSNGWILGELGAILHTTNGGITGFTSNGETLPADFALYQNYPNPFNPVTKIQFEVAIEGRTSIVVYDILGRQIAVLTNEYKKPGKYEIEWNAGKFASGIYFYRLARTNFTITKKMLLIR